MKPYYEHAGISIYLGNALDIMPTLATGGADVVLTDPPYGISLEPQRGLTHAIVGDSVEEAARLYSYSAKESARILKPNSNAFYFGGWSECHWNKPLIAQYLTIKSCIVWIKNRFGIGYYTRPQHEFIWYCWKGTPPTPKTPIADVIDWPIENGLHSCQKPLGLCKKLIAFSGGGLVLDPFCGSGTTLQAAKDLGHSAIGIEIEEKYCEIAAKRLSQEVFSFEASSST